MVRKQQVTTAHDCYQEVYPESIEDFMDRFSISQVVVLPGKDSFRASVSAWISGQFYE